ncbi:MAG: DUF86 domain-containing protein [Deltaproteobacteria bacterium]|jgi:uncharacterized protein with HEPN domain|nr:DUF86 domain-containing protein [Deltaproteobacteria bacterium]
MKESDITKLSAILSYCNIINSLMKRFGNSLDILYNDTAYQLSISFCLEHIGEKIKLLSPEFMKQNEKRIPFKQIIDLRNRIAHDYASIEFELILEIITYDIPVLEAFCKEKLDENQTHEVRNDALSATTTVTPAPTPSKPKFKP